MGVKILYDVIQERNRLRAVNAELVEACEDVAKVPKEALDLIQRHGYVFDNNGGSWEKLAFTLYNMLIECGQETHAALARAKGEQ